MVQDETRYILVVDDDANVRQMLLDVLGAFNLEGRTAENGQEALKLVAERLPCAIVLDLMMPVMDGFATITALQANRATRHIPILVLSAVASHTDMAKLPGVFGVIRKGDFSVASFQQMMRKMGAL